MPRILIAECKQEVSTFNPHLSGYDDFTLRHGQAILDYHRQVRSEVGGALSVLDANPGVELVPTGVRLCYFPQATYGFVATFLSDRKEQAALEVTLDLHSGREERHLAQVITPDHLSSLPAEPLPEAPHRSVPAGFAVACRQVARSLLPLANQRRRELQEHTGRQIDRGPANGAIEWSQLAPQFAKLDEPVDRKRSSAGTCRSSENS